MKPSKARNYCERLTGKLKQRRHAWGLYRWHIARLDGPEVECLKGIEHKRWTPTLFTFVRLADALGFDVTLVDRHEND